MNVVAMLDRAEGNESVGEMWTETRVFPADTPLADVIAWALKDRFGDARRQVRNLRLQLDDGEFSG